MEQANFEGNAPVGEGMIEGSGADLLGVDVLFPETGDQEEQKVFGDEAPQEEPPQETVEAEPSDETEQEPEVDAPKEGDGQDKIGKAFAAERRRLEAKYKREAEEQIRNNPIAQLGRMVVEDLAKAQGITMEQAVPMAYKSLVDTIAKRNNVSPEIAARVFLPQTQQRPSVEQHAEQIKRQLAEAELPDGFDFDESTKDEAFVELLTKMPVEAAARLYHAESRLKDQARITEEAKKTAAQDIAEKLQGRQTIPQPEKPGQQATPIVDFFSMSDDEFLEYEEKTKRRR